MNIMFVDDNPGKKVNPLINYLEEHCTEFTSIVIGSTNSAIRYISEHGGEVDLAVVDLGLPMFDDGTEYNILRGLDIIESMYKEYTKIPIIINSTTDIPEETLEYYADRLIIKHYRQLDGKTLLSFTQKGFIHLIEPNFCDSGKFTFWVDSEDEALFTKYFNQLTSNISEILESGDASVTISSNHIITLTLNCNKNSDSFFFLETMIRRLNDYMLLFEKVKF